jgi:hypothetical protein
MRYMEINGPKAWVVFFVAYAMLQILWVGWVAYEHISFPLNLEAMETTVVEHVDRVLQGRPLYEAPEPGHVALAYNPLFYYLCAAFASLLGNSLATIRIVAVIGTIGAASMIYSIVKRETESRCWGLIAVGMFAAAYRAMDSYFDIGHRDTWMLFLVLAGCAMLNYGRSGLANCGGMLLLVAAFWLKQQAAAFVIGGYLFLLFKATPAELFWPTILSFSFGPALYVLAPSALMGPEFHYFTWDVPRQWTALTREDFRNFAELLARRWLMPTVLTGAGMMSALHLGALGNIWIFMMPVAFGTALLGMTVSGSNNNVFIPFETWLIVISVVAIERLTRHLAENSLWPQLALSLSFLALAYNPASALVPGDPQAAYRDLVEMADRLKGAVYAPWLGNVPGSAKFQPAAHWVPLEDMVRGSAEKVPARARIAKALRPASEPANGHGYILTNTPIENDAVIAFLQDRYVLDQDFGDRFRSLQGLTRRYTPGWPRYLYRYDPASASASRKLAQR